MPPRLMKSLSLNDDATLEPSHFLQLRPEIPLWPRHEGQVPLRHFRNFRTFDPRKTICYLCLMSMETLTRAWEVLQDAYQAQMEGDYDRAVELYQSSLELHPTAEAHTFLGWTYHFQGRIEEAIAECKRAIELDPEFGNPYNDIGAYLIELGRFDEAMEIEPRYSLAQQALASLRRMVN